MANSPQTFEYLKNSIQKTKTGYLASVSDNWRQGRTAYGGLTAGLALRAIQLEFPDLPPLRSANINFIGPVSNNPVFQNTILRQGKNVISIESKGLIGAQVISNIVFIFGQNRTSELSASFPGPPSKPPEKSQSFVEKAVESFLPPFLHNFDLKLIDGHRPMSGAKKGYIRVWARHKDVSSREGIESLLTISDVLPPAAIPLFTKMGPISSVNFLLNILNDNPSTDDGWWHIETKLTSARNGYSSQVMRIWNMDGELIAEGMQCVAIFI